MEISLDEFCPCCDYNTLDNKNRLNYSICPICYWEDDPIQFEEHEYTRGANKVSLTMARKNYKEFEACEKGMIKNTRRPTIIDKRKDN